MGWYSVSSESEGGEVEWGVWGAGGEAVVDCGVAGGGLGLSAIFGVWNGRLSLMVVVVVGSQDIC